MEQNKVTYKEIFRESEYRKLIFSNLINRFGDSVDAIAFTWLVYQITHSAAWSAIVFALNTLPNVVVQPFAGAIVEKLDKKAVIVITNILRAIVITGFAIMYKFGMVNAAVMAAVTLIITTIESFDLPASSAFTQQVVKKEHLTTGLSLNTMLSSAATLVGTGIAGIIVAAWGVIPAMIIDVVTFLISAALVAMMKSSKRLIAIQKADTEKETSTNGSAGEEEPSVIQTTDKETTAESFLDTFKDGIRYVSKTPVVRNFCFLCIALNFMLVPINALTAPIASEIFKQGGELLSFAGAFASIGGIVGAALLPYVSAKMSPLKITCAGIGILGLGILGIAFGGVFSQSAIASYAAVSVCFFAMMVAASLMGGILGIQFMKSVDSQYMSRASAVFNASATASMPVGSLLVSALLARIATERIMLFAAGFAAVVLLVTVLARPELEKREEIPDAA